MTAVKMKGMMIGAICLIVTAGAECAANDVSELARIQDHLARVASLMRATPPANLTRAQREARRTTIDWLEEYRAVGVFPHNHVRPGERVPVFVDPHGTPCAVGYLLLRSGQEGLVESVVRTGNLARVPDLAGDVRMAAWLDARGLTLDEAALIQPAYDPRRPQLEGPSDSAFETATVGLSLASAALASYVAMVEPTRAAPWIDALALGTTVGHAYLLADARDSEVDEPGWTTGLNVLGLVLSAGSEVYRVVRRRADEGGSAGSRAVHAYTRPGRSGTEIGVALRR